MIFESVSGVYEVVNLTAKQQRLRVYRCRRDGREYVLYQLTDEELKRDACERFERIRNTDFDGLEEIFTSGDDLIIVFRYHELSETAAFYSDGDSTEAGKVRFFGDMLAALCIHAVPEDIAADLIENDNVGLTSDGNPECRYELKFLTENSSDRASFSEAFEKKLRTAFESVGRSKRTTAVEELCDGLVKAPPADIMELFSRYEQCVEPFSAMGLGETPKQRAKRIAMKVVKIGKTVLAAAVLGIALFTLGLALFSEKPSEGGIYQQIGSVKIEEYHS